jgi:RluA family pseudouridine synthase
MAPRHLNRSARASGAEPALTPEEINARVLHRDGLMLVIDKPAGVPVHRGPGGGVCLEDGFGALRFGLPRPPHLAHRLDRDTSGCLILGRHKQALARLGALFASGAVEKVYWALVRGAPPAEAGVIDLALAKRSTAARGWWMAPDLGGQPARTEYRIIGRREDLVCLELRPRTGRTHQIRVHLAAIGCPVIGDRLYGGKRISTGGAETFARAGTGSGAEVEAADGPPADSARAVSGAPMLFLHARAVTVPLYPRRPPITVTAPAPPHMRAGLAACGITDESESTTLG